MFRQRRELSPARRWARVAVWVAFGAVLGLRFLFPPEHSWRGPRGAPGLFVQNQRLQRPPTRVNPPEANVPAELWRIQIEIPAAAANRLRNYHWGGPRNGRPERPEVTGTVREGGITYTNVAIHLKGAAGSFRRFDDKPALTLHFSKHAPGQEFHGYNKISLNNSVQDPSYLSEAISREMFEAAGVPVPRAGHATVLINGRDLGLYVMTEGFGKPFLKRYFKNVKGNLYDGGFCQEINTGLDTNSGDSPNDRSDIRRLIDATRDPDPASRWKRLNQMLDMERFISFLAMEVMTCHWDGYGYNRNNYRLFHDLETDRMVFMPHGMDQMFGWGGRMGTDSPIDRLPNNGMVARVVLGTPEGRKLYYERIASLRTNVFLPEKLTSRVQELSRRIRPTLAAYSERLAAEHDRQMAHLCQRITRRARSLSDQLEAPKDLPEVSESIAFDANGAARLAGWTRRITTQPAGEVQFNRRPLEGKSILSITASRGGGSGSWRKRVTLAQGRYRLEGRARTHGVGNNGGICLRISGARINAVQSSESDWTPLRFVFAVAEPVQEVELVCELRATRGEAWFDENSLRLVRE